MTSPPNQESVDSIIFLNKKHYVKNILNLQSTNNNELFIQFIKMM